MGSSSVASRATAALLGICKELGLEPAQQFRSLSLFADRYLPALGGRPLAAAGAAGVAAQPQLLLSAAACVLLVLQQEATGSEQRQQLSRVYTAAGRVLGADFEAEWQSSDLTAVAALVQQEAGPLERRQNAASFVELFYQQIQQTGRLLPGPLAVAQAGLKAFASVDITVCHTVMEMLYFDGGVQFRGALERGGKLMAAAVIAAAFCLAAPLGEVQPSLPFLTWLADLAGYPKDVIRSQAAAILQHVLG